MAKVIVCAGRSGKVKVEVEGLGFAELDHGLDLYTGLHELVPFLQSLADRTPEPLMPEIAPFYMERAGVLTGDVDPNKPETWVAPPPLPPAEDPALIAARKRFVDTVASAPPPPLVEPQAIKVAPDVEADPFPPPSRKSKAPPKGAA